MRDGVTGKIKAFYEANPFPHYRGLGDRKDLKAAVGRRTFMRLLDEQIPDEASILEVGCGTGQLSNFLALKEKRAVFAVDLSSKSLEAAVKFKKENRLNNVTFSQMDLFKPIFKPESFDFVICSGVLHHTRDPFLGFQEISKFLKKGGFTVIGLYNTYGRIPLLFRRFIIKTFGERFKFLDPRLRSAALDSAEKRTWFMDQYKNPHESTHTIGEVSGWFKTAGFEFVKSIPEFGIGAAPSGAEKLFESKSKKGRLDFFFAQLKMAFKGEEGGFFVVIGKKK